MENRRRFLRFEVQDFLEVRPLNEVAKYVKGKSYNLSLMGICFSSEVEWKKGQVLFIDYFIPEDMDSIQLKISIVWSEFINEAEGYLTGAQIIHVDPQKELRFVNYYFQKLKEKFFR